MTFFKQYIQVVNYALIGLVFGFASFYLLVNAYHYLEIRKDFYVNLNEQPLVTDIEDKLSQVSKNISEFNVNTYHGNISASQMSIISANLKNCVASFHNETMTSIKNKDRITIIDVYNLRESYENNVLSDCIVNGLYWTTTIDGNNFGSEYLVNNKDMIKLHVESLLNETSYLKKDLMNNSSYFFSTAIASSSIKDNTKDGFYEVMSSYNRAADFVVFVSEWFKNEVEGNYE